MKIEELRESMEACRSMTPDWDRGGREKQTMSILSNAQEEMTLGLFKRANDSINLAKLILMEG